MFGEVGGKLKSITHDYANFNWIFGGSDTIVCRGDVATASTRTAHGGRTCRMWGAGRWCDVFEIRDFLIQRVFIYLDPDYAGKDTGRYPWLAERGAVASPA